MGYFANFIVYTLAMLGVIVFALFVYKSTTSVSCRKSSKLLKVVDSMSLGQRKMLYIVSAGKEKFLIAGDVDKTSLISKLDLLDEDIISVKEELNIERTSTKETFQDTMKSLPQFSYLDRSVIGNKHINTSGKHSASSSINTSVMRNLAERIKK